MDWSEDASQEVADLRAATQTDSAVLELDLAGSVRHASDAWLALAGLDPARMVGQPIGAFVRPPDKDVFVRAADEMRDPRFTGGSVTIWVSMHDPEAPHAPHVDLEAQGIIINPQVDADKGHVMWLVSRFTPRPTVSLQLPHKLARTTGFATDVFAAFLEQLADAVRSHAPEVPAIPQELCRICERFVKTWWFERHHWLCSVEHKNEERINASQEALHDHRDALIQMLAHPAVATKHAVRVSSPLARPTTPTSAVEPATHATHQPVMTALQQLIELCDRAIELDLAEVKLNDKDLFGPANSEIIAELKRRPVLPVPESLVAALDATNVAVNNLVSAFERYGTFISYRRVLWAEVEEQVREAIDATVAAAESTTAPVVIEASSAGSTDEDSPKGDSGDTASCPLLETDDEEELKNVLNRKRGSRSHPKARDSPRLSPHPSPRLSPHLSPKLWPSTPSRRISRDAGLGSSALSVSVPIRRHSTASMLSSSAGSPSSSTETDPLPQPPSIRDYEIVKPISRGAYGVVYLARKRLTGEFFAIKVLKKSDMVAKNQVTHIKHERQVLISTASSPYVATLFFTFQSRDFLYLVMEYVHGGDCAALLKTMGCLSEEWAKQYLAEIIVAVDSLHSQGILHRDLKPDNLLIDKRGHLKLSDFGLSATTANNMQTKTRSRTNSFGNDVFSPVSSPMSPAGSLSPLSPFLDRQKSLRRKGILGTPDYLAPETIEGLEELTDSADWWAVGCIFFELVYGFPPFNDQTPQKVFENILKCRISWPEIPAEVDISDASKELIKSFLVRNPKERLGANGSDEVMNHPYFKDVDWTHLFEKPAPYTPETENPISTTNFDDRGALGMKLPAQETDLVFSLTSSPPPGSGSLPGSLPPVDSLACQSSPECSSFPCRSNSGSHGQCTDECRGASHLPSIPSVPSIASLPAVVTDDQRARNMSRTSVDSRTDDRATGTTSSRRSSESNVTAAPTAQRPRRDSRNSETSVDEFGSFTYRNIPVLEKANNEVITKIRTEERRLSVSSGSSGGSGLVALSSPMSEIRPSSPMYAAPAPHVPIPRSPSFLGQQVPNMALNATTSPGSSLSSSSTSLAQQNEDAEKEAALLRVRRRQQLRRSFADPGKSWYFPLNVLLGGTPDMATKFTKLGCRVINCTNANDVCLKANSAVHFDLIVLGLEPNDALSDTSLTSKEICRVIRSTMNPNRETPIVQVQSSDTSGEEDLPAIAIHDEAELAKTLKSYCNWEPTHQAE